MSKFLVAVSGKLLVEATSKEEAVKIALVYCLQSGARYLTPTNYSVEEIGDASIVSSDLTDSVRLVDAVHPQ